MCTRCTHTSHSPRHHHQKSFSLLPQMILHEVRRGPLFGVPSGAQYLFLLLLREGNKALVVGMGDMYGLLRSWLCDWVYKKVHLDISIKFLNTRNAIPTKAKEGQEFISNAKIWAFVTAGGYFSSNLHTHRDAGFCILCSKCAEGREIGPRAC